jgi:hypothetical protein
MGRKIERPIHEMIQSILKPKPIHNKTYFRSDGRGKEAKRISIRGKASLHASHPCVRNILLWVF